MPLVSVLDLTFTFNDRDQAYAKLDGELGNRVRAAIEGVHPDIKILHFWDKFPPFYQPCAADPQAQGL